jgi:hypothetical protein
MRVALIASSSEFPALGIRCGRFYAHNEARVDQEDSARLALSPSKDAHTTSAAGEKGSKARKRFTITEESLAGGALEASGSSQPRIYLCEVLPGSPAEAEGLKVRASAFPSKRRTKRGKATTNTL